MNTNIERVVGLSPNVLEQLKSCGIVKVQDFYEHSPLYFLSKTKLNINEINDIASIISRKILPTCRTALSLYNQYEVSSASTYQTIKNQNVLSTGSSSLNDLFEGTLFHENLLILILLQNIVVI